MNPNHAWLNAAAQVDARTRCSPTTGGSSGCATSCPSSSTATSAAARGRPADLGVHPTRPQRLLVIANCDRRADGRAARAGTGRSWCWATCPAPPPGRRRDAGRLGCPDLPPHHRLSPPVTRAERRPVRRRRRPRHGGSADAGWPRCPCRNGRRSAHEPGAGGGRKDRDEE